VLTSQRRNKKGNRYIVSASGPARPTHGTRAMPLLPEGKGAPTLFASVGKKFAGLKRNAESSVLKRYLLVALTKL